MALFYLAIVFLQASSALPSTKASTKPSGTTKSFHNDTTCHNLTEAGVSSNTTLDNHSDFLSTTTFGVLSVLLAFGSLVVGILALLQYRKRKRIAHQIAINSDVLPTLHDAVTAAIPLIPTPTPTPGSQRPHNTMLTLASSSTSVVQTSAVSTSSTLVPDTMAASASSVVRQDPPPRPLLSNLRKRSSQWQSQTQRLKLSYRTSTY